MSRITSTAMALLVLAGCSAKEATGPSSGDLHITKDCSAYTGAAGSYCTITSSNLMFPAGTRITYKTAATATALDTDIVLDPPGGNSAAFGHCTLDFVAGRGVCTLSGGTGSFKRLRADVAVSYVGGPNWAWDGTYSLNK